MPSDKLSNRPTFEAVFREHAAFISAYLLRLGVQASDAQDIAQETFIAASRQLPELELTGSMRSWIIGICMRKLASHRRAYAIRGQRLETLAHQPSEAAASPEQLMLTSDFLDWRGRKLEEMSPELREAYALCELAEMKADEAAKIAMCPTNTLTTRLHRARLYLSQHYARERGRTLSIVGLLQLEHTAFQDLTTQLLASETAQAASGITQLHNLTQRLSEALSLPVSLPQSFGSSLKIARNTVVSAGTAASATALTALVLSTKAILAWLAILFGIAAAWALTALPPYQPATAEAETDTSADPATGGPGDDETAHVLDGDDTAANGFGSVDAQPPSGPKHDHNSPERIPPNLDRGYPYPDGVRAARAGGSELGTPVSDKLVADRPNFGEIRTFPLPSENPVMLGLLVQIVARGAGGCARYAFDDGPFAKYKSSSGFTRVNAPAGAQKMHIVHCR